MKLVLVFAATLMLGPIAHADAIVPADPYGAPIAAPPPTFRATPGLRRAILERFDRNHDGRLEPRERRQAARALRRLARKLATNGVEQRRAHMRKLIRKYDLDGDGNVGPGEMPPAMAKRLRPLDRDGNGWIDDADFGE